MKKKTLLFVAHGLAPESYGGVEVYTRHIYDEFRKSDKIEPAILARTNQAGYPDGVIFGDEEIPSLFYVHTPYMDVSSLRNRRGYEEEFRDFLISLKPEFVHFQHYLHLSLDWIKVVRDVLPMAKIIFTFHEYMLLCPNNGQMIKTQEGGSDSRNGRLCSRESLVECEKCFPGWSPSVFRDRESYVLKCIQNVDLFTAPSHFLKDIMIKKLGIPEGKIVFSENGQAVFESLPEQKRASGRLTLGFLGQINEYKGLHVLLDALAKIEGEHGIFLKIHGFPSSGPGHSYFKHKIKPRLSALKQVECCGAYTQEQLPAILAGLDMVVVPSIWWENSPLVIQEAFMAKVPVLCSGIGGMAEKVTEGVNGMHFPVNDSEVLRKKILSIYKNKEKLREFRKNIHSVKTISENRVELEEIYLSL